MDLPYHIFSVYRQNTENRGCFEDRQRSCGKKRINLPGIAALGEKVIRQFRECQFRKAFHKAVRDTVSGTGIDPARFPETAEAILMLKDTK